ncbi:MAG: potassium transporter TrkA [Sphingomonadales bacterium]|nr:potassium transporter TrkA [Sphingomonadales bacterium]
MTTTPVDPAIFKDAMIVLATAAIIVPLVKRWKVSPVLAFLLAGAVLGPNGIGAFAGMLPQLGWLAVGDEKGLGIIGELGVVFLLFLIGLELSAARMLTMRRLVFGLGTLQVVLSAIPIALVASWLGARPGAAVIIGASLALSSTAIVVEVLSQRRRLTSATGRVTFAILLLQDLAVMPLLFLVAIQAGDKPGSLLSTILQALGQAGLAVAIIIAAGWVVMRPLFRLVAASASVELFVAATLFVAVGSGLLSAAAGLSMTLGAFLAGLLLAETEYRKAIEATVEPFKGLLLGVFFFSVGMDLDVVWLARNAVPVLAATVALLLLKGLIVAGLARAFSLSGRSTIESAFLLAPGGEFAFIAIGLALAHDIVKPEIGSFAIAITTFTMVLIPLLDRFGRSFARKIFPAPPVEPLMLVAPPDDIAPRAIVVGHGRVGELVADMLARHGVPHLITERDAKLVGTWRGLGRPIYYGDAKNPEFLKRCGIAEASAFIITIHLQHEIDELVRAVRELRPDIVIVARARDAQHASHLYDLGVTDAVPETIEASLQLSEAALVGLGIPTGPVIASIHEKRDEYRAVMQAAAGRETLAIRTKQPLRARDR